jgi:hypothetical protein
MGLRFRLRRAGEEKPPLWLGLVEADSMRRILLAATRYRPGYLRGIETSRPRFLDVAANTADREHAQQNVSNALTALRTADRFMSRIQPGSSDLDQIWQLRNQLALRLPAMVSEYGLHGSEPGDAETQK